MLKTAASIGGLVVLCSVASAAQGQTSPAPPAASTPAAAAAAKPAGTKSDLDKVVCRAEDTIGTRLGRKMVCMTVGQWLEFQNDVKDQMRRIEVQGKSGG